MEKRKASRVCDPGDHIPGKEWSYAILYETKTDVVPLGGLARQAMIGVGAARSFYTYVQ